MAIYSTSLTLGTNDIYTSSGNTVVSVMYFCNLGSAAANLNVWTVAAGTPFSTTANLIYREVQLAAADTFVVDMEKLVLGNGDKLKANSGGTVSATVSYVGI